MRSDFTAPFETARNKKAHEPVTLIQLDFPAVAGFPALTLRLAERGSASDESKLSIGGNDWHAVIEDAGDIDRLIDATQFSANSDADLSVTVVNLPTDLFSPAQPFAWVFRDRPPESATAIV
ncbi:MAG: hypothetical protein GWM98_01010, partial [Nitrospinaceae bacterium]|nr:hypothetical protein [Nitrospinaceae bacterium]